MKLEFEKDWFRPNTFSFTLPSNVAKVPRWQPVRAQQGREKHQRRSSVGSIATSDDISHRLELQQYEEFPEAILEPKLDYFREETRPPSFSRWTKTSSPVSCILQDSVPASINAKQLADSELLARTITEHFEKYDAVQYIMLEHIDSERNQRATSTASSRTLELEEAQFRSLTLLKTLDMTNDVQQEQFLEADNLNRVFKVEKQGFVSKGTGALRPVVFDDLRRANEQFEQLADLVSQAPTNEPEMTELWRIHDCNRALEDVYVALQHRYHLVHSRHHLPVHTNFRISASANTKPLDAY
ncbi:hypothetical protein EI94DRAFT_1813467 [Lactarius quietus]|nr:hypothetical protein EI94DRAFT_1813467 [Lactarius quietus]